LLLAVQRFYGGVGHVHKFENMYMYEVNSLKDLSVIRTHFENYPLPRLLKSVHFQLWSLVMTKMLAKEHLTLRGFISILSIKAVFPQGLNAYILEAFPSVVSSSIYILYIYVAAREAGCPAEPSSYFILFYKIKSIIKPDFINPSEPLEGDWIAGFTQADGTFGLNYTKNSRMTLGYTCQPQFRICGQAAPTTKDVRDTQLLLRIIDTLGCGTMVKPSPGRSVCTLSVSNHRALYSIIVPF